MRVKFTGNLSKSVRILIKTNRNAALALLHFLNKDVHINQYTFFAELRAVTVQQLKSK